MRKKPWIPPILVLLAFLTIPFVQAWAVTIEVDDSTSAKNFPFKDINKVWVRVEKGTGSLSSSIAGNIRKDLRDPVPLDVSVLQAGQSVVPAKNSLYISLQGVENPKNKKFSISICLPFYTKKKGVEKGETGIDAVVRDMRSNYLKNRSRTLAEHLSEQVWKVAKIKIRVIQTCDDPALSDLNVPAVRIRLENPQKAVGKDLGNLLAQAIANAITGYRSAIIDGFQRSDEQTKDLEIEMNR